MVDITVPPGPDRQVIQAYGDGGFRISGERYIGAVLIFPDRTVSWPVASICELSLSQLQPVRESPYGVEILLIGTGQSLQRIDTALHAQINDWGVVMEAMDTGAACRTYNVLLLEDRRVAAALLPIA